MASTGRNWGRRQMLGALGSAAVITGCSGSDDASDTGTGSGGTAGTGGGTGGSAGSGTGGSAGSGTGGSAGGGTGGSAGAAGSGGQCTLGTPTPGCRITDDNILGPYYKAGAPLKPNLAAEVDHGTGLVISGRVYGCDCVTPLVGAIVDVWQADADGIYDSVGYVLRGTTTTDADGRYELITIVPGYYLNGAQYRPSHVHYKVSHASALALTTQLYFEGDPYLAIDPYVKPALVRPFTTSTDSNGALVRHVEFDIILA